jgi:hypothetical protein
MQVQIIAQALLAFVAGAIVGASFGLIQEAAWRRHQKLEQTGKLNSGWAIMPGSMRRVAYLLVALALVQLACPLLFANGLKWWVSGGVAAGYGVILFRQLRHRLSGQI